MDTQSLKTGQYYDTRTVEGPRALEAARDFAKLAGEQVGIEFPVDGRETDASINLEEWPSAQGFKSWFQEWATRWDIEVED
jgi:hypothetical protein